LTDEDLGELSCGIGECERIVAACLDGQPQDCVPGDPTAEICDGLDNDCDDAIDEDLGTLSCGVGECARTVDACVDGQPQQCVPGDPTDEVCDGLDNDCDGATDEGCDGECDVTIDIDPNSLNRKSKGKWITCYIEMDENGCDVGDIDVSSILLNNSIPAASKPTGIGDHDDDGISDLMVKFSRNAVIQLVSPGTSVTLTVSGSLNDGTEFEGNDSIKVIH
jgi:hypothetical protein